MDLRLPIKELLTGRSFHVADVVWTKAHETKQQNLEWPSSKSWHWEGSQAADNQAKEFAATLSTEHKFDDKRGNNEWVDGRQAKVLQRFTRERRSSCGYLRVNKILKHARYTDPHHVWNLKVPGKCNRCNLSICKHWGKEKVERMLAQPCLVQWCSSCCASQSFHCWFRDRLEMHTKPRERADQQTQLDQAVPERFFIVHCKDARNSSIQWSKLNILCYNYNMFQLCCTLPNLTIHCNKLRYIAMHDKTLKYITVHTVQYITNTLLIHYLYMWIHDNTLQYIAIY